MKQYILLVKETGKEHTINPQKVDRICLEMAGGGYNDAQVMAAMVGFDNVVNGNGTYETKAYKLFSREVEGKKTAG